MCGILGTRRSSALGDEAFAAMLDRLAHRGPDGSGAKRLYGGRVLLGHRRLAIIDPSPVGAQPMSNGDGSLWLTFNGEIYDYVRLRTALQEKGHRFRTRGDSETILHAYEEWGEDCVHHLTGIFAFAIWDARAGSLFLARDHLGVKPLYYTATTDPFTFASQPSAIALDPAFSTELDPPAFRDFLTLGQTVGERSIFRGIRRLLPGHTATLSEEGFRVRRYWRVGYAPTVRSLDEAVRLVDEAIRTSVSRQLTSDVPVSTFLSGGIDSSLVTALAARASPSTLRTFTLGFDVKAFDERGYARIVSEALHTDHHEHVAERRTLGRNLVDTLFAFDEPFEPNGPLPAYLVSRLAAQRGTKVVLGGDGADELFAGYGRYARLARRSRAEPCGASWLRSWRRGRRPVMEPLSREEFARLVTKTGALPREAQDEILAGESWRGIVTTADTAYDELGLADLPAVTAAQYWDLCVRLPDRLLCKVDRASMANGVEVRVPFLAPELVELAFRIPAHLHLSGDRAKAVLKRVARRYLPAQAVTSRKQGFGSPLEEWGDENVRRWLGALLDDGHLVREGILRRDWSTRLAARRPDREIRQLWVLATAEIWVRRWLGGQSREDIPSFDGRPHPVRSHDGPAP